MKVLIVTSMANAPEIVRIREELGNLGHESALFSTQDFKFTTRDSKLSIPGLTDVGPDIILLRGILTQLKPIAEWATKMREKGAKVFDNNFLRGRYSISKVTDLVKLAMADILVPDASYYRSFDDFFEAGRDLGYPMIIKSTRAGQGVGVFKVDTAGELPAFIAKQKEKEKKAKNYILQEFIDYEFDLRVLVIGQKIFTMQRIPKEGDFRANFSLGGSVKLFDLDSEGKKLALAAMDAVGMSVAGVDILIDKNGKRYILEVNHTAGMKGMEEATGENIVKVYVEHVLAEAR